MQLRISALSRPHLLLAVTGRSGGAPIDPTADVVAFAFLTGPGDPVSGDWKTGDWETDSTVTPPAHFARILVGPGSPVALARGTYNVWLRITDNPEQPIAQVGRLIVE